MNEARRRAAVWGFWAGASLLACSAAQAETLAPLTLKRVALTAAGVAQLELEARVKDEATLTLQLRPDQIDDALKSLIVDDPAGAGADIQLDAAEPLSRRLADGPIPAEGLASPQALFNSLRGAKVKIGEVEGAILSVTDEIVQGGTEAMAITKHRLTLSTADGLKSLLIEDAPAIKLLDPTLNAGLERALAAVAAARDSGPRAVLLRLAGRGERVVRVALLTAAPAWKTAWRLDLAADPTQPARLQGWAIFENVTALDWKDVQVTLSSGAPAAFRQELWASRPVHRPLAPPDVAAPLLPPVDAGTPKLAPPPPEPGLQISSSLARSMANMEIARPAPAPRPAVGLGAAAPEAEVKSDGVSVRFDLPQPVTLAAGRSLSAPFLDRPAPAVASLLHQPRVNEFNPIAGVELKNDGAAALPPGPIAVYRAGAWIGDARIGWLPVGESRLASFAVDRNLRIITSESRDEKITAIKAAMGVIELRESIRRTVTWAIAGTSADATLLSLETEKRGADERAAAPAGATVVAVGDFWRVSVPTPPKGATSVTLTLSQDTSRTIKAVPSQAWILLGLSDKAPDAASAAALKRVKELVGWKNEAAAELTKIEAERKAVIAEQERLRANLQATQSAADLQRRYQKAMAESEDRLAALQKETERRRAHAEEAEKLLAEFLANLTL